jgi:hypothetical protein
MKSQISSLSKKELLERAEKFIFSTGINDSTSILSKKNMRYGIAQMQIILEKHGFEPKATFISTPDETVSRNIFRWNSGFGYGGKISWGSGTDKIIFLNTKPNQCGILVGGLEEVPEYFNVIKRLNQLNEKDIYYKDIKLNLDYGVSNHFINCFERRDVSSDDIDLPPYIFMIHGSAPELRNDDYGLGVYIDKSLNLKDLSIKEETVFGTQFILLDDNVEEYLSVNYRAQDFSAMKRKIIAEHIFGKDFKEICSQTHQFLYDFNNIYLGCHCTNFKSKLIENNYFPIVLNAKSPAYLFKGKENFSESLIERLGFSNRANELEVMILLKNANVLPHGGGYSFPDLGKKIEVLEMDNKRYFICEMKNKKESKKVFRNPKNLQFIYRGKEVMERLFSLGLGECIAKLIPLYSLKM